MSQIRRVSRYLFVHYCGQWTPRAEVTDPLGSIFGRKYLAQRRRRWHSRPGWDRR